MPVPLLDPNRHLADFKSFRAAYRDAEGDKSAARDHIRAVAARRRYAFGTAPYRPQSPGSRRGEGEPGGGGGETAQKSR